MGFVMLVIVAIVILSFIANAVDSNKKKKKLEEEEERDRAEREERRKKAEEEKAAKLAELKENFLKTLDETKYCEISVSSKPAKLGKVSDADAFSYCSIAKNTKLERYADFVVIDTETTGLSPSSCEILEFSAMRIRDWVPVEIFTTLCSTKNPIPDETIEINGITEEMVEGKPRFQSIAVAVRDFIGDDAIVGHNLEFDLKFLMKYGAELSTERKCYDTLKIARNTIEKGGLAGVTNYKLQTLCEHFGFTVFDAHRSLGDCYATAMLFNALAQLRTGEKNDR